MAKETKKENGGGPSWLEALQNPRGMAVKRFMFQVLGDKFPPHDDLITRIATCLITDNDMIAFNKLVNDIYDIGFTKAIAEYKKIDDRLTKMGIPITVKKTQVDSQ